MHAWLHDGDDNMHEVIFSNVLVYVFLLQLHSGARDLISGVEFHLLPYCKYTSGVFWGSC